MSECKVCGSQRDLIKVKDEEGNVIYVCQDCYESVCEGYERIEE
jgi:ribosome-binding protein aMBF1 (putative translation factor)